MIEQFTREREQMEEYLDCNLPGPDARPRMLHEAMRYAVLGGGKRLRPILSVAACEAVGGEREVVMPVACAVELIHTYSLIHDDLPCMDDDDLRRGKPTCHKKYGEAAALLAGDALLTLAFEWASRVKVNDPRRLARIIGALAEAAGSRGMVGGQAADLAATGTAPDGEQLEYIHTHKTADLITASVVSGGLVGNGNDEQISVLRRFGLHLGMAFQFIDDVLDCTSSVETLGKTPGKDEAAGKVTAVAVYGREGARNRAQEHVAEARKLLAEEGWDRGLLRDVAEFIVSRPV